MDLNRQRADAGHKLCRSLRSKEMSYQMDDGAEAHRAEGEHGNHYFWCLKTALSLSPAGDACGSEECTPSRTCYEV